MRPAGICSASGKVGYANQAGAELMIDLLNAKGHAVCEVYKCGRCGNWHLTSMPRADVRRPSFGRRLLNRFRASFEVWPA